MRDIKFISNNNNIMSEWVSECLMFNAQWKIAQLYNGENKLRFNEMIIFGLYEANMLNWKQQSMGRHVTPLLTHYPDSKPTNRLFLILNAVCLEEKQQILISVFGELGNHYTTDVILKLGNHYTTDVILKIR